MSESIRDGYKMTELGEMPEEWENLRLGTIAFINRGFTWKKIQENQEHYDNTIPVIRIGNIKKKLDTDDLIFLGGVSEKEMKKYRLSKNDIIMVGSNGNHDRIGNICIINEDMDYLFASFLIGIKVKNKNIFPHFLYYFLSLPINQKKITDSVTGTTGLGNLSLSFLDCYNIVSPPLPEQHRIVEILFTIDETIERTEALIEKYRHIKAGLMSDLLTRGIDEEGRIRSEETHEFKDSPLGRVPEEWEVVMVKDITISHKQGYYTNKEYSETNGIKLVRITDLLNPKISYETMPCLELDVKTANQFKINIGDFLVARSGAIGRYGIVTKSIPCVFGSYIIRFQFDPIDLKNHFFGYLYESNYISYQLFSITQGSSNININAENIKSIRIPLPPLPEQHRIAKILTATDTYIEKEQTYLNKLQQIKKGLMQDLLTGKVRVTITPALPKPSEAIT